MKDKATKRSITKEVTGLKTRAMVQPETFDKEKRTVEVVFATETEVLRWVWGDYGREQVKEVLSLEGTAVRMQRLNSGASVLNTHSSYELDDVIGVVEKAWIDATTKQGRALLRLSDTESDADIVKKIETGIIRNISVGYNVYSWTITETAGQLTEYRATDWEPVEISFVPVPADYNSGVRSNKPENEAVENPLGGVANEYNQTRNNSKMKKVYVKLRGANTSHVVRSQGVTITAKQIVHIEETDDVRQAITDGVLEESTEDDFKSYVRGLETPPTPAATPNPAPESGADLARTNAILQAVERAGGSVTEAREFVAMQGDTAAILERVIEKYTNGDNARGFSGAGGQNVKVTGDDAIKFRNAVVEGLSFRAGVSKEAPTANAREYSKLTLVRLAMVCLERAGISCAGLSNSEIARAAFGQHETINHRGMATSDFPIILGNVVNRSLQNAYAEAERTFLPWTRRGTMVDFKEKTVAQLSGLMQDFIKVPEGGEYQRGSFTEKGEKYSVAKFGRIININWETIINDDLDAFSRVPQAIANMVAQMQSDIIYGILEDNAALSDSIALFHADHANLIASGTTINVDNLGNLRQKIREQTGMNGKKLSLKPQYLIVGPTREQLALQYTSTAFVPATNGNVNPWAGTMEVIVEPRIEDNRFYMATNPNNCDTIEWATLEGEGDIFTETRYGFEVDGVEIKARTTFGAKAIDHRGMALNPGN